MATDPLKKIQGALERGDFAAAAELCSRLLRPEAVEAAVAPIEGAFPGRVFRVSRAELCVVEVALVDAKTWRSTTDDAALDLAFVQGRAKAAAFQRDIDARAPFACCTSEEDNRLILLAGVAGPALREALAAHPEVKGKVRRFVFREGAPNRFGRWCYIARLSGGWAVLLGGYGVGKR
jgi:hypothetical protein